MVRDFLKEGVENSKIIDTTEMTMSDIVILVVSEIMDVLRKKYIETFQQKYHL